MSRRRVERKTGGRYEPAWAGELAWVLADAAVLTRRSLVKAARVRALWLFIVVQPLVFVLMLSLVFGEAIVLPGDADYPSFVMAGVFALSVTFATSPSAVGIAIDQQLGLMDRFRSMPIHPGAILVGHTVGDLARLMVSIAVMGCCGLAVGWRISDGFLRAVAGFALLAAFGFAMSWIGVWLGLAARSVEVAANLPLLCLYPITFVSSAFVPAESMPAGLEPVAEWNPVSAMAGAAREMFGNPNPFADSGSFPAQHPVVLTVLWSVLLIGVAAAACTRRMRRMAA